VTLINDSSVNRHSFSTTARLAWIVLILVTLYICYFHNLGVIGLVGPDEPRYAWIARDMVESGDWVTPRLYGKPWFEKPVLYYWGAALSFKLFGVGEVAARLPSAFSALLATLAMAWLAWRVYGAETARWLLLLLPTTVGMIGFSHAAAMDMPFSGMLTIALVCSAIVVGLTRDAHTPILPRTAWFALLLFGFFLGLATLAKGPAAIVLAGGAALLRAVLTKRWRDAFRCLHPVAIASFCLTALPWYILCARHNPEFFRIFIIEHNLKRYLTPQFQHIQPFWFYIPILLVAFVPWTMLLVWATSFGSLWAWHKKNLSPLTIFLLCWSAFCLLFFSVSQSKLPGYILPAIPAMGLLLARSYVRLVPEFEKAFRWVLFAGAAIIALLGLAFSLFFGRMQSSSPTAKAGTTVALVLLLFALANLLLAATKTFARAQLTAALSSVLPVLLLVCLFGPLSSAFRVNSLYSGQTIAGELAANNIPSDQLYYAFMHRGQQYSLSFYLHHEIQQWNSKNAKPGYLLVSSRNCKEVVKPPWMCSDDPIQLDSNGWLVYRVAREDLMSGLGRLGEGRGSLDTRDR